MAGMGFKLRAKPALRFNTIGKSIAAFRAVTVKLN